MHSQRLVAKFSLRKLVTQQLWLYLISQAGITAFRTAALKDNIVDQGGWLQNVLLPWRHMWYLYALMFWMLTVPLLRAIQRRGLLAQHRRDGRGHCHRPVGRLCQLAV